ncbi:hypothetical protein T492DRAFT_1126150, partial [Pavlovales sp. CCMP2436]
DFDGTLAATPTPEAGISYFEQATGQRWPHVGWWGRVETLSPPLSDLISDGPALADFLRAVESRSTSPPIAIVMVTGRLQRLAHLVEAWMSRRGVRPDQSFYHNGGGSTFDVKVRTIRQLLVDHPYAAVVEMWEDRVEHAAAFELLDQNLELLGRCVRVRVHRVGPAAAAAAADA